MVARRGVCTLLRSLGNVELMGTCDSGVQVLALAENLQPDLVLLDLLMPGLSGDIAASYLRHHYPRMRVILMSVHDTAEARRLARLSGAHAFVSKHRLSEELVPALRAAFAPQP